MRLLSCAFVILLAASCNSTGGCTQDFWAVYYALEPVSQAELATTTGNVTVITALFEEIAAGKAVEIGQRGKNGCDHWDYTQLQDRGVSIGTLEEPLPGGEPYFSIGGTAMLNAQPGTSIVTWQTLTSSGNVAVQLEFPSHVAQVGINAQRNNSGEGESFEATWRLSGELHAVPFTAEFSQLVQVVEAH